MTTRQNADMRRRIRAAGSSLNEERSMAMKMQQHGASHAVVLDEPRTLKDEWDGEDVTVPLLYGPEGYCQTQKGTVYPLAEVLAALMR